MKGKPQRIADYANAILQEYRVAHHLHLCVEHCTVRVSSNSAPLIDALDRYFRNFVVDAFDTPDMDVTAVDAPTPEFDLKYTVYPPGPGKNRIKEEYADIEDGRVVLKVRTGMVFLFGGDLNVAVGPCMTNQNQVVNFVNNRLIQLLVERGYLLCHASAVARRQHGICIAGVSGRGKSTLALHLIERGLDFVTNDRLLIGRSDGVLEMLGLPKYPRVNPGTILNLPSLNDLLEPEERERFEALTGDELWELEHKFDVDVNEIFGDDRLQLESNMVGVVLLNWERGAGPFQARRIDLAKRRDLLHGLMKSLGVNFHLPPDAPQPDRSEEAYLRTLADCPAVELAGGVDFQAAADECIRLIDRGGGAAESPGEG